jgi:hypothetical protein
VAEKCNLPIADCFADSKKSLSVIVSISNYSEKKIIHDLVILLAWLVQ